MKSIHKKTYLAIFLFLALGFNILSADAAEDVQVRCVIIKDAKSIRLKVNGFYELLDLNTGKAFYRGKHINVTVVVSPKGILFGKFKFNKDKLLVKTIDPEAISVDSRKFRGSLILIKKNGLLACINKLPLEDYVKGILYNEASHYWPLEALKVQAIVSRTYVLSQLELNKNNDFDVTADVYSQVYGGRFSERQRTNLAVEETKGLVLTYMGKIFPTYFHATCGGHTEDAAELWNVNLIPLKGVVCPFCQESPHYSWHAVLSKKEVIDKLVKSGFSISNIDNINISKRNTSGRVVELEFVDTKKKLKVSAKELRQLLGVSLIKSTKFDARVVSGDIVFEGFGWGHGVGLCQWGAYFMAKQGKLYSEILKYYYPGSEIILEN